MNKPSKKTRIEFNRSFTRRDFLKFTSATLALSAIPGLGCTSRKNNGERKMILSFYMDDTNPEIVSANAFKDFLDYCKANGIKGESSFILGYNGKSVAGLQDENHITYLERVRKAHSSGIDSHMEIMTHRTLFDFEAGKAKEDGIHEGLWLHEPDVPMEMYRKYFSSILSEAAKAGIKYTGLTWPGCGCEACTKRYGELKESGPLHINDNAFEALLVLAREGRFRNRVLPVFYEASETDFNIYRRAADGQYGVYDLQPNTMDHFGIWENSSDHVDPDYYITEDGQSGMIINHLNNKDPYCLWYMHWQGVNPEKGVGWEAFKTVNERIRKHLSEKTAWMRPGEIVTAYHDSGGWDFIDKL